MMRTFGLVLAMLVLCAGASMAVNVSYDIYGGWNLITAPLVPFNPDPLSVFAGAPDGIDGVLTRVDPTNGNITYDGFDPAGFGNVLLGDGYWLFQSGGGTISYDGVPDGVPDGSGNMTDMWISLPGNQADAGAEPPSGGGWHLIGQPFNHDTNAVGNLYFTDGSSMKTWEDAVAASWVDAAFIGANASTGGFNVQFDGFGDDDHLRATHGYWIRTYKDNIALVIPALPS